MKSILSMCLLAGFLPVGAYASVDNALMALVPANSKTIAGIDVEKCRASDFGQFLLSKTQANDAHFDQFMADTGFDPRRDLQTVVITSSGGQGSKSSSFSILARGNFDAAKIRSMAIAKGAEAQQFQGIQLLVNSDHGQSVAFGFPDVGLAVMGDLDSIHVVIQNFKSPSNLDVDLMNRAATAASSSDAWFVSSEGGAAFGKLLESHTGGQMDAAGQTLQAVTGASGGIRFGAEVAMTLDAVTRTPQDATSLADVFRFAASMVQMGRQKDPRAGLLASSLDNMQLATNQNTVHVAMTMSEKSLEQIAEMGPQRTH